MKIFLEFVSYFVRIHYHHIMRIILIFCSRMSFEHTSNVVTNLNLPSWKYCVFRLRLFNSRTSSGVMFLNGWFNATMCIEKPNTNMASTTKKRPKSFIKSPMMIAQGPNRWWNDKKSNIWTHASRKDKAKHWFRTYINVGQYSTRIKNMPAIL